MDWVRSVQEQKKEGNSALAGAKAHRPRRVGGGGVPVPLPGIHLINKSLSEASAAMFG